MIAKDTRVAVIMPYHDGMQDYIEDAIKGVAEQEGVPVVLCLVDNSIKTEMRGFVSKIVSELQQVNPDFYVRKYYCDDPGVAPARNCVIADLTNGDFADVVAFCDCDDVWEPNHLRSAIDTLNVTGADMVYSDVQAVDERGNQGLIYGIPYYDEFSRDRLLEQNFIFISSVVLRKECLRVGQFDHDADPMGDWDYWIRVSQQHEVVHNRQVTLKYLWKVDSGSYYGESEMRVAFDYVQGKHANVLPEGWLTEREGRVLRLYAMDGMCLEIGSYKGRSSKHIAATAKHLVCVDTFKCTSDGQTQSDRSIYEEFARNVSEYQEKITPMLGRSADLCPLLSDGIFDMIFLDAMHDYDSVVQDIRNYWPKLKLGGHMLFHDFDNHDYPGVMKACTELLGAPHVVTDSIAVYLKIDSIKGQDVLPEEVEIILAEAHLPKLVAIAPFARALPKNQHNGKNMPVKTWIELIDLLRNAGICTVQVGSAGEPIIGADLVQLDLTMEHLTDLIDKVDAFVSVDTFLQHMAAYRGKRGVVIFSQSDPDIFGHSSNVNLLKSREYLRVSQYELWSQTPYLEDAFPDAQQVFEEVLKLLEQP